MVNLALENKMIDKILGKETAEDIFYSGMITGLLTEKQACDILSEMEKGAAFSWAKLLASLPGGVKTLGSGLMGGAKEVAGVVSKTPGLAAKLALIGAGTGVIGATAYDILKENVTNDDPKAELNAKIEAMYRNKRRELDDSKWMTRVREMRDELKRGYKKMTTEEYAQKYNALMEALDERRA
jgi:hypothetical protein